MSAAAIASDRAETGDRDRDDDDGDGRSWVARLLTAAPYNPMEDL